MSKSPENLNEAADGGLRTTALFGSWISKPSHPGWWIEWDGYRMTAWEVEDGDSHKYPGMWIYWNGFWREVSTCLHSSVWTPISPPNDQIPIK